jgi:hypothetical protein
MLLLKKNSYTADEITNVPNLRNIKEYVGSKNNISDNINRHI